jgi:hypothetical protein
VKVRPANASDAAAIAAVCNEIARELYGEDDVDEATVRNWLELPNAGAFVAEAGGRIRGYGDVQSEAEASRFSIDVRARGDGATAALVESRSAGAASGRSRKRSCGATSRTATPRPRRPSKTPATGRCGRRS